MSRKVIVDFRKVADKLSSFVEVDNYFFENIIPIYEDSLHTPEERAQILESDTLWLLNDMVQADRTINRRDPDPKQRIPFFNYRYLLETLIQSTADKGIYLSESFVKAWNNVDMGAYSFGKFVRDTYAPKWWETKPQHKEIEALQQPNGGNDGELKGNGKKPQPKPKKTKAPKTFRDRVAGNIDASDLLRKLHTLMDNKSGKDALVYLTICIADGKLNRPTFSEFQKEFTNICRYANYYRYTDKAQYTADELTAARIAYSTCK